MVCQVYIKNGPQLGPMAYPARHLKNKVLQQSQMESNSSKMKTKWCGEFPSGETALHTLLFPSTVDAEWLADKQAYRCKFYETLNSHLKILVATVKNLVAWTAWCLGFLHHWIRIYQLVTPKLQYFTLKIVSVKAWTMLWHFILKEKKHSTVTQKSKI